MDRTLPIAWPRRIFRDPPRVHPAPEREAPGVRALYYDALPWRGHDTRVFAWLGFPKRKKATPCPGMVLIHGGGGTAFAEWVRLWNSRGGAAQARLPPHTTVCFINLTDARGCVISSEHRDVHPSG